MAKDELESALFWLPWIKTAKFWAGVLVAVGIAGEILGDRLAAPREKIIEDARESQIAQLNNESQTFRLKAAELEQRLADRKLSAEQQARLIVALKPFAGTPIFLKTNPDDGEARNLCIQLNKVLGEAGWQIQYWRAGELRSPTAILIQVDTKGSLAIVNIANALRKALKAEGLQTVMESWEIGNPTAQIRLWVGSKP